MIEAYCDFTFILPLNVVVYIIMFGHGVYHFTANRKESCSLPVAASYLDLQTLYIFCHDCYY